MKPLRRVKKATKNTTNPIKVKKPIKNIVINSVLTMGKN